jgi:hypothetical protein
MCNRSKIKLETASLSAHDGALREKAQMLGDATQGCEAV